MLKVAKFGGSSLADASCFEQVRSIVQSDPARRVIVVSAPGRRHAADHKITDLLYLCHAHLVCGVPFWSLWKKISSRFLSIRDACVPAYPLERELEAIYASADEKTPQAAFVCRGEYLCARLMAAFLGFEFVDSADWLRFDAAGNVLTEESYALLRAAAENRRIVTPGFYGTRSDGALLTFSRGGSDVTGSLAAAALGADVYENWTDVPGVLQADPRIVRDPPCIAALSFRELQLLSQIGMQVLHESAVEPVRSAHIPLNIRSSFLPAHPGTLVTGEAPSDGAPVFASRGGLSLLVQSGVRHGAPEAPFPQTPELRVVQYAHTPDSRSWLVSGESAALHAAVRALRAEQPEMPLSLTEDLTLLAAVRCTQQSASAVCAAVLREGAPIRQLLFCQNCLYLLVDSRLFVPALRSAAEAVL